MKRIIAILVSAVAVLVCAGRALAQELLVPAGTLLQCTLDEPNFSSATAAIGDPVGLFRPAGVKVGDGLDDEILVGIGEFRINRQG
jgi:hypothetical protein